MNGKNGIKFSELFADTLQNFGYDWCLWHYQVENGMEAWEFDFWVRNVTETITC